MGDNPLGYWRLGEASGATTADRVGGGAAGTYNGFSSGDYGKTGPALTASGDNDTAAGFDGADTGVDSNPNYITIPSGASIQARSARGRAA